MYTRIPKEKRVEIVVKAWNGEKVAMLTTQYGVS